MAHSEKEISTVRAIIKRLREIKGEEVIPETTNASTALDTIRLIQSQRRNLHQSGVKVGLRQLTKKVSEAQMFTLDESENRVLQYAYQVVAMNYFGDKRKENAVLFTMYRESLAAQTASDYERESQK